MDVLEELGEFIMLLIKLAFGGFAAVIVLSLLFCLYYYCFKKRVEDGPLLPTITEPHGAWVL